jgi:hypothetical protein
MRLRLTETIDQDVPLLGAHNLEILPEFETIFHDMVKLITSCSFPG